MINKISIKTKLGWITAFEENNRIFRIKFGKIKKQTKSVLLKNFKSNLSKFFNHFTFSFLSFKKFRVWIKKFLYKRLKKISNVKLISEIECLSINTKYEKYSYFLLYHLIIYYIYQ